MKCYIDLDGRWYKAEQPRDPSHAHRPVVTEEFLAALDVAPQDLIDVDTKVKAIVDAGGVTAYTKQKEEAAVKGETKDGSQSNFSE